jgi:hypothetical protein
MITEKLLKSDISISSSGDNTIISAPSGTSEYIAIDHINIVPNSSVSVQLKDGSTNYGGAYLLVANQDLILENSVQNQDGVITLSANSAFVINLSSATQVSGFVRYRIINK